MELEELPGVAIVLYFFATVFFYMVREQSFLPDPLYQALFVDRLFLGMQAPGFFWIGAGIFGFWVLGYVGAVVSGLGVTVFSRFSDRSFRSEGVEYLERHGVEWFEE